MSKSYNEKGVYVEKLPRKRGRKPKPRVPVAKYDIKQMADLSIELREAVSQFSMLTGEEKREIREKLGKEFVTIGRSLLEDNKHDNI